MTRAYFPIREKIWKNIASILTNKFSLPQINSDLAIYCKKENVVFELNFQNNRCFFRSHNKDRNTHFRYLDKFNSTPPLQIENRNIKFFLKIIHQLGFNEANISEITKLDYHTPQGLIGASIKLGTLLGDLLVIDEKYRHEIELSAGNYVHSPINEHEIDALILKRGVPVESIFSNIGTLNSKIQNFADRFAIDMSSGVSTIATKIASKSNDYSFYNRYSKILIKSTLDQEMSAPLIPDRFKPLSIIIPAFNSNDTILRVLYSIQSQNLSETQKASLDVIIVDDGSDRRVYEHIAQHLDEFDFHPKIIRLESNQGLSTARNIGFHASVHDRILFIDSDILLANNYLYEHSIRLQLVPDAIFVSLKENVSADSIQIREKTVRDGLPVSNNFNDKRLVRTAAGDRRWTDKAQPEGVFEILNETNLFKNYGYGRVVNGCYDLASCVVGHNMSMNRDVVNVVGGFSNNFTGWGLEDAYFGARAIAAGYFIVPIISTNVYHIDHPPRSGSEEQMHAEYKNNEQIYNRLIHQQL